MSYGKFHDWLIEYKGLAKKTASLYTLRVNRYNKLAGSLENSSPDTVYKFVVDNSKSVSAHNSWVGAIKKFEEYQLFLGNKLEISSKLRGKANNRRLPKPFTEQEIDDICAQIKLNTLQGRRDRAIIELLYCGLRNAEACSVTLDSLGDATALVTGKGSKERYVPINDVAWHYLLDYIIVQHGSEEDLECAGEYGIDHAFVRMKARMADKELSVFLTSLGREIYPRAVRSIVYRYAKWAGVENAHPHRFRHSFATHTLDSGLGNLTALKDVLGHSKFDMVQRYVLTTKVGRERVKSFHPRQRREMVSTDV